MSAPSTEPRISIHPHPGRVVVRIAGEAVADSDAALCLRETGYAPVYYLPRAHVRASALAPSEHSSHCPHKGDARYWTLAAGADRRADAVWSYEQPHAAVAAIAGYLAFDPQRVDAIEVG